MTKTTDWLPTWHYRWLKMRRINYGLFRKLLFPNSILSKKHLRIMNWVPSIRSSISLKLFLLSMPAIKLCWELIKAFWKFLRRRCGRVAMSLLLFLPDLRFKDIPPLIPSTIWKNWNWSHHKGMLLSSLLHLITSIRKEFYMPIVCKG